MLTVTETYPGAAAGYQAITAGPGSVTVDTINSGPGLQGFTLVSSTNATVNIPAFPLGTYNPVTATFVRQNPALPVDFTLRASSRLNTVFIRAQCQGASASEPAGEAAVRRTAGRARFLGAAAGGTIGRNEPLADRRRKLRPEPSAAAA